MNQIKTNKIDLNNNPSIEPFRSPSPDIINANQLVQDYISSKQNLKKSTHINSNIKPANSNISQYIQYQDINNYRINKNNHNNHNNIHKNSTPSTIISKNNKIYTQQTYQHDNYLTKSKEIIITQVKDYQNHQLLNYESPHITHFQCSCQDLHHKQQLINELRKILAMISDSQFVSQFNTNQNISENQLKKQIQNLRIKNQALQKIINQQRNQNKNKNVNININNNDLLKRLNFLQHQNHNLKNNLNHIKFDFQRQINSLIQSNQSLTIKLKSLDEASKGLVQQNQRLLFLLRNKDDSQRKLYQEYQDLKQSILLKTHQINHEEAIVNSSNISINSQIQREKRLKTIKQRYNNSLQLIKNQLESGIKSTLKINIKKFETLQKELQKSEKRLQTLNNVVKASLIVKGKTQFMKKSKMIRQTYQIQHQTDLKKTNEKLLALKIQKQYIIQKAQQKQQNLLKRIDQLQTNNQNLRKNNIQRQQKLQQLSLQILANNTKLKDIESFKNRQIEQLNKIIVIKNHQIQEINKIIQFKISEIHKNTQLKQEQWRLLLSRKEKQFQQLQNSTQNKVKQLMASYQKQIDLKNKQISRKNSQLKEFSINKTDQQKQLLSQLKLLQFEKNDLLQKITRSTQNHQYQLSELNFQNQELYRKNEQKENSIKNINLEIQRLMKILQLKDNSVHQLNLQVISLKSQKQDQNALKQALLQKQKQFKYRQQLIINDFTKQLQQLKRIIIIKQNELKIVSKSLQKFRSQSIIKELSQIKQLVNNGEVQKLQLQLKQINISYQRVNIQLQKKMIQNDKLCRQKIQLRQNIIQLQQKIITLQQKIRYLNKNTQIYSGQLKQRKQLIQGLIQQKSILEKEMILLKKNSFDNKNVTITIENIMLISKKIDQLLIISTQRQNI